MGWIRPIPGIFAPLMLAECHYRYPDGDYCKFFYYPSRPAWCVYQGGQGGQDYPH